MNIEQHIEKLQQYIAPYILRHELRVIEKKVLYESGSYHTPDMIVFILFVATDDGSFGELRFNLPEWFKKEMPEHYRIEINPMWFEKGEYEVWTNSDKYKALLAQRAANPPDWLIPADVVPENTNEDKGQ